MTYKLIISLISLVSTTLFGEFNYDIHVTTIPGKTEQIMLCMHGMGGDYRIGDIIKNTSPIEDTLVSFNFPDHSMHSRKYDPHQTCFGTIQELLPPLSIMKKLIVDEKRSSLNLYGFSAGGGAIINILAVLNTHKYDAALKEIGIHDPDKKKILMALQNGIIILDTPLKSLAEIIAFRGKQNDLDIIGKRYHQNGMEPIDSISHLKNLSLHFIVHFQTPDEVLSNRDDMLFIERLKSINLHGKTEAIFGSDNGHMLPHASLWRYLKGKQ